MTVPPIIFSMARRPIKVLFSTFSSSSEM